MTIRQLIALLLLLCFSANTADAQTLHEVLEAKAAKRPNLVEKPRLRDNWSLTLAGGAYHPMFYDLRYLVDCSGLAGAVELRKQLTPIIGLGLEADGYYRMQRDARKDPRTIVGTMFHINIMNLFGGYRGRPRIFELEAGVMPAWGHLYRGSQYSIFHDENYFTTKYELDLCFNMGRNRAWALSLRPAWVFDVKSYPPNLSSPEVLYDGYTMRKSDLQLFLGLTYRFRNHDGRHSFTYAQPQRDVEEVERLNEIVNYLRSDVDDRDAQIKAIKAENERLKQQLEQNLPAQ